jgi:hypothetical protein
MMNLMPNFKVLNLQQFKVRFFNDMIFVHD